MIYAIGDIHGCAQELKILLHRLPLGPDTSFVFLGDYIDRGPDSKAVVDTILDLSDLYPVVTLKGNHEWLLEKFIANPEDPGASSNFIFNGGGSTLASYSKNKVSYHIPEDHLTFFKNLKLYHSTPTHFYVHAGVPPDYDLSENISEKTAFQFLWIRSAFLQSIKKWPKLIVHGHTPVKEAQILPNRINLDTGCVFGRKLSAMNMETGELFSVERNQVEVPSYLIHSFQGQDRARRFVGEVQVEIQEGAFVYHFQTVNYNEFGLLIFPTQESLEFPLEPNQRITGRLRPEKASSYDFEGTVVRIDKSREVPRYGIKIDGLKNS